MGLAMVEDDQDFARPEPIRSSVGSSIPNFEGQEVQFTKGKVTSASNLEIDDQVFKVDDIVKVLIECRVVSVDHKANERSGSLERIHTFKAIDAQIVPYGVTVATI